MREFVAYACIIIAMLTVMFTVLYAIPGPNAHYLGAKAGNPVILLPYFAGLMAAAAYFIVERKIK